MAALISAPAIALEPSSARELHDQQAVRSREDAAFMKYLVSCALPAGATVRNPFPTPELPVFKGEMGLVPAWATRALNVREQRELSACLFARTNALGIPVLLSMRSQRPDAPPSLIAGAAERRLFPRFEGAFFGNAFAAEPVAFVCHGDVGTDREHWLRRHQRLCTLPGTAAGLTACGFVDVGRCSRDAFVQGGIDYADQAIEVFLPP